MRIRTSALVATLVLVAGCASSGSGSTSDPSGPTASMAGSTSSPSAASPSPDRSKPVGLIAMGHSGITGEGTGGGGEPVPEKSWATGTLPEVDSVYLRMVGLLPATEGNVFNAG